MSDYENLKREQADMAHKDNLPAYPHGNEPRETVPEHHIERTMGHEVRPAPRPHRQMPEVFPQERALPRHMMSCSIPETTNASRLMRKPMPKGMTCASRSMFGTAPAMTRDCMRFDAPQTSAPRGSRLDPFKGMRTPTSKKKKTLHHIDPFRFGVN